MKIFLALSVVILTLLSGPRFSSALTPEEVLVVANFNAAGSLELAAYYMKKRGIPNSNLLKVWVDDNEKISRKDYDKKIEFYVEKMVGEKD